MKINSTKLFVLAFLTVATGAFAQTIRRLNNNAGITLDANMYATLQAAHDAAASGDIIYLESSPNAYGDLTCTKQLTIVGTGYLLNENHIYTRATQPSTVGNIALKSGSTNTIVEGLTITGAVDIIRASNITIRRNYMSSGAININTTETGQQTSYSNISNISIIGNYMLGVAANPSRNGTTDYTISNLVIANNSINYIYYSNGNNYPNLVVSAAILNNILTYGTNAIWNTSVHNNIFVAADGATLNLTGSNNTVSNNLSADIDCLPAGNGNVNGIILADTFLGFSGNTNDTQWKLKPGSAAIGAGVGGVDCGMYGGATPYVMSGIPAHPTINFFNSTGVGNSTTPLNVTISTKTNN
jgi:hypothetical protein